MDIYIDLLVVFNTLFDYVLFYSVNYILKRNCSIKRMLFTSLVGNISLFLLEINNAFLFVIFKLIFAIFLNIICFGYKNFRYLVKNLIYFYLVSMLMGGVVYFFDRQFTWGDEGLLSVDNSLFKYFFVVLISVLFIYFYLFKFRELKNNYNNYYDCLLYIDENNSIKLSGFLDTGNKLKDPYSNKNIILINKSVLGGVNLLKPIYVPYNSLNNHGLLKCFKANKIIIDGKENDNFLVGVSETEMFIDGIDCILNISLMEGLR